jgi:hypothetical protein
MTSLSRRDAGSLRYVAVAETRGRWQDLPTEVEIGDEDRVARLEARLAHVLRQLETRIAQVDELNAEIVRLRSAREDADRYRRQFDALMATKTMRALRIPRQLYTKARARRT